MNRRDFIYKLSAGTASVCLAGNFFAQNAFSQEALVEARYYKKLPNKKAQCLLCPRKCLIDNLETGYCGVRANREGVYYTLSYNRPVALHNDPIEKKPFFHFLPGSSAFSLATVGCNVNCKFCQNWDISQVRPEQVQSYNLTPAQIVANAKSLGSSSIAYTYSEPVVFYEYMFDIAVAGRKAGIRSVMISNGYINLEPLAELCKVLDAVKIDLKAFTQKFYDELVTGELQPVLDTLVLLKKLGMWSEIVYLVIPGKNDNPSEIRAMAKWIKAELGADIPTHFSRYHPQYLLKNIPPTPVSTLKRCYDICRSEGLNFVYIGNVPGEDAEKTYCPACNSLLVDRIGFTILSNKIKNGKCWKCNLKIPGVWS
jgi:pyruvate formate lyase activating enzyme